MDRLVCHSHVGRAVRNSVMFGHYPVFAPERKEIQLIIDQTEFCMREDGTHSDFMLLVSMLLEETSRSSPDFQTIEHLGMLMLPFQSADDPVPIERLKHFLHMTLPTPLQPVLYSVNLHLWTAPTNEYHEALVIVNGSTGELELWDSSRPSEFAGLYRTIAANSNARLVPTNRAQRQGMTCGFWSLWYLQKRIQKHSIDDINAIFTRRGDPLLNESRRKDEAEQEIGPRMVLLAQVMLRRWNEYFPDRARIVAFDETPREMGDLQRLVCDSAHTDIGKELPDAWRAFVQTA